jgi:hypothetical protein
MRESSRPSHDRAAQACDSVFILDIVSPSTCLPNPPPYARMRPAFWRLSIMPAGWQRVATRRTAGNLLPGKCGRYTSSPHPNCPNLPGALCECAQHDEVSSSRCSSARLPCRPFGSLRRQAAFGACLTQKVRGDICHRAAHHAQECIRILWHRLEQPVNPAWRVGLKANAASASLTSW